MNWRTWRWLLAGVGLYLIILLATFPAYYVVSWLQRRMPEVQLIGVHGSVWAGSAQESAWHGQSWGSLRWRFDWSGLFTGHLGYRCHLDDTDLALEAQIAGNSSKLLLQNVSGHLPVSRLAPWLPLPPGSVAGELNINVDRVILVNGRPVAATGIVNLTNLDLSWPQSLSLGDYQLKLQTQADGVSGNLLDTSGPLMLQGNLRLALNGGYQVSGVLASRDPSNVTLNNLLHYLPSNQDGKHTFSFNGNW